MIANRPQFTRAPAVRFLINIGAGLDVPTGIYLKGKYGEYVLNGGLGMLTGTAGKPNSFKSTLMHYQNLAAMERIFSTVGQRTAYDLYDTEINVDDGRMYRLTTKFDGFKETNILHDGLWQISSKGEMTGEDWFEMAAKFMREKKLTPDKEKVTIPFLDRDQKELIKIPVPSFFCVDSFSAFGTSDVDKIRTDNQLGESGGNMAYMRQGLARRSFLDQMPSLAGGSYVYASLAAHIGDEQPIQSGPMTLPPEKKLQHLPSGKKIKGVTDQFLYLTSNFWFMASSKPCTNSDRFPEYPRTPEEGKSRDNVDLYEVSARQLRGKAGSSGFAIDLIVSQTEGVLASLSEFHNIRTNGKYFGLDGGNATYNLSIYPEVKLSRNTIRNKLDEDPKLRRAVNITAELYQMDQFHPMLREFLPTPQDLYTKVKEKGYDWDFILTHTRGWATVNNDDHPTLWFLSTYDIVRMANGDYHPYWMEDDKKTIKKEFQKKAVQL